MAHDLHPQYMSTRFAQRLGLEPKVGVQHHHAHIASCMAENHLSGKVIGVAFDGTGYGTDGKIWGGEFLVADFRGFERRAHLRYVPLPGGDAAVRQPWRMALSYLRDTFGPEYPSKASEIASAKPSGPSETQLRMGRPIIAQHGALLLGGVLGSEENAPKSPGDGIWSPAAGIEELALFREVPQEKRVIVDTMLQRHVNCFDTSSCGRLFDAVSSIVGLRHEVTFEGQAAIELEMIADARVERAYPYAISEGVPAQLDMRPMIEAIVADVSGTTPVSEIAAAFHNTLATAIVDVCRKIRENDALNRVCLSGGTFQNVFLLQRTVSGLRNTGFEVFLQSKVPPNDGGIALGQAVIANAVLAARNRSDNK